jgi:hypothetical protein
MTSNEAQARELADAEGLTRLGDKHLGQLGQAIASARELGEKLPKDLHWSEESALVFRLRAPEGGKP